MFEIFTDFAIWLVVDVLGISTATKLGGALHFFIEDTTKIFFIISDDLRYCFDKSFYECRVCSRLFSR